MLIKSVKNKDYGLLVDKIKINMEQGYLVSRLKNMSNDNFYKNTENNLWYYKNYKKESRLIDIFYPDKKIIDITFIDNDTNNYLPENLIIKLDTKYENNFIEPNNCTILEKGTPSLIKEGVCSGEYRNMYWKINDYENKIYYIMHIKDNIYTKISKRDINKILSFNGNCPNKENYRPTWRLFQNGYVCCTINYNNKQKVYYLHQLILDVHNEDLTSFEKTVDHINRDKLDNRRQNLRLVDMSIQNTNRDKSSRRKDACELPNELDQKNIPKYVVYRKEFIDKEKKKFREYFYICNHPNMEKRWETSKSSNFSIHEKLHQAKLKIQLIENKITQKEYDEITGNNMKPDFPKGIRLVTTSIPYKFIFDLRQKGNRYGLNYVLKSNNLQNELNKFIELINEKYTELKILKHIITNTMIIHKEEIFEQKQNNKINLVLPPNFSFYFDSKSNFYYYSFNKVEKGIKQAFSKKILSNNVQNEFNTFMKELNEKYEHIKPIKFTINNTENIKLYNNEENYHQIMKHNIKSDNKKQIKNETIEDDSKEFKLPTNISVVKNTYNDYYLQFTKLIDGKRIKKMVKLNTNDFQSEFNNFIDMINELYKDIVQFKKITLYNIPKEYTEIVKELNIEQVDNTYKTKPVMPQNFSICNVNQVDYFQFNKKIDEKRFQYKTKINSYDLQIELENFIDQLNEKYDIGLIKSEYKIINTNGWKTTNKIIEYIDTDEKIAQRLRTLQNIEKKKQAVGIEEYNKQKALYAKQYRESKK